MFIPAAAMPCNRQEPIVGQPCIHYAAHYHSEESVITERYYKAASQASAPVLIADGEAFGNLIYENCCAQFVETVMFQLVERWGWRLIPDGYKPDKHHCERYKKSILHLPF